MPCQSDYLEPTSDERRQQTAAQLLVWLMRKLGQEPNPKFITLSRSQYAKDGGQIPLLCKLVKRMDQDQKDQLIYLNGRDSMARRLADWIEEHEEADRRRALQEAEDAIDEKIKTIIAGLRGLPEDQLDVIIGALGNVGKK